MEVRVRVPASTTNLGPGFDALGVALGLHNELTLRDAEVSSVEVSGEGAGLVETGPDNLVQRAAARLAEAVGAPPPRLHIRLHNRIPVSRGLGSSSAAIVGGLVGANALLGSPLSRQELLGLAVQMEGHPDNVTPALFGGFHVMAQSQAGLHHVRLPFPNRLRVVVCIPGVAVSTEAARRVLPDNYSRADMVFNLSRSAMLVAVLLTGELTLLREAMEDRVHQPYRSPLIPGFDSALRAARAAGAAGACLSGSGSTLLALTETNVAEVGEAMTAAVRAAGTDARWLSLEVDEVGAETVPSP